MNFDDLIATKALPPNRVGKVVGKHERVIASSEVTGLQFESIDMKVWNVYVARPRGPVTRVGAAGAVVKLIAPAMRQAERGLLLAD